MGEISVEGLEPGVLLLDDTATLDLAHAVVDDGCCFGLGAAGAGGQLGVGDYAELLLELRVVDRGILRYVFSWLRGVAELFS